MLNRVSKNWVSIEGCGSSSRTTASNTHQKHPEMVQEETLDCSKVASNESRSESHPKLIGDTLPIFLNCHRIGVVKCVVIQGQL